MTWTRKRIVSAIAGSVVAGLCVLGATQASAIRNHPRSVADHTQPLGVSDGLWNALDEGQRTYYFNQYLAGVRPSGGPQALARQAKAGTL